MPTRGGAWTRVPPFTIVTVPPPMQLWRAWAFSTTATRLSGAFVAVENTGRGRIYLVSTLHLASLALKEKIRYLPIHKAAFFCHNCRYCIHLGLHILLVQAVPALPTVNMWAGKGWEGRGGRFGI